LSPLSRRALDQHQRETIQGRYQDACDMAHKLDEIVEQVVGQDPTESQLGLYARIGRLNDIRNFELSELSDPEVSQMWSSAGATPREIEKFLFTFAVSRALRKIFSENDEREPRA